MIHITRFADRSRHHACGQSHVSEVCCPFGGHVQSCHMASSSTSATCLAPRTLCYLRLELEARGCFPRLRPTILMNVTELTLIYWASLCGVSAHTFSEVSVKRSSPSCSSRAARSLAGPVRSDAIVGTNGACKMTPECP